MKENKKKRGKEMNRLTNEQKKALQTNGQLAIKTARSYKKLNELNNTYIILNKEKELVDIFLAYNKDVITIIEHTNHLGICWLELDKNTFPIDTYSKKDVERINEECTEKIIWLQKHLLISMISYIEYHVINFIEHKTKLIKTPLRHTCFRDYLEYLVNNTKVLNQKTKKTWLVLIDYRNDLVHRIGIAKKPHNAETFHNTKLKLIKAKLTIVDIELMYEIHVWILINVNLLIKNLLNNKEEVKD